MTYHAVSITFFNEPSCSGGTAEGQCLGGGAFQVSRLHRGQNVVISNKGLELRSGIEITLPLLNNLSWNRYWLLEEDMPGECRAPYLYAQKKPSYTQSQPIGLPSSAMRLQLTRWSCRWSFLCTFYINGKCQALNLLHAKRELCHWAAALPWVIKNHQPFNRSEMANGVLPEGAHLLVACFSMGSVTSLLESYCSNFHPTPRDKMLCQGNPVSFSSL